MKRLIHTAAVAAATFALAGAAASSASALSLGPAGKKITGVGQIDYGNPNFPYFYFSGLQISCSQVNMSGTLNGSASVTAAYAFSGCKGYNVTGPATVVAPGGLTLSLTSFVKRSDGAQGRAQLTSGPRGLTFTLGACTLTVPPNVSFATSLPSYLVDYGNGHGWALLQNLQSGSSKNPYTGSSGCPAAQRGTHTTGSGLGYYTTDITGLALAP